ncbi:OTU deubiquitinase with linear linkage specificity a [Trichomycterus rosablanca]|uniref:OTU deubiquitinase with linear linkage specificity a n=1 Tax=Trichomycterus rosablanca TaxID=2290929 RepID=UPI002F353C83
MMFLMTIWMNSVFRTENGDGIWKREQSVYVFFERIIKSFRDGSDAGKEASLQIGFNLGYREGAGKMKAIGQLKGIASALQHWCQSQPSMSPVLITQLLQRVEKYEEDLFEAMRKAQELPPPSVKDVVEEMEDLGVEHSGGDNNGECCKNDGRRECCGQDKDTSLSSFKISTESGETLEQLLHTCMELASEMGLPDDLKLHIQQLRCT